MRPTAITPATKTDPSNKSTRRPGPVKAPRAPASFQSPAPRLRRSTKGSSNARPTPTPSSDASRAALPPRAMFMANPVARPGTVSQFGIRRLRKSVQPAIRANSRAPIRIGGLKSASGWFAGRSGPRLHHIEKEPCWLEKCETPPLRQAADTGLFRRIFTWVGGEVNVTAEWKAGSGSTIQTPMNLIQFDRLNEASGENLRFRQRGLSSHPYCRCMRFVGSLRALRAPAG